MGRFIMNDLDNWTEWKKPLLFSGVNTKRIIEVEVNCEKPTTLHAKSGEKGKEELKFVGVLPVGKTKVQLSLNGNVWLVHKSDGEVWWYNSAGRNVRRLSPEQRSYTGPLNREVRNPELEKMMFMAENRMINRIRKREAVLEAQYQQRLSEETAGSEVNPETGVVNENAETSTSTAGSGQTSATETAGRGGTSGGEPARATGTGEGQGADTATPPATP